ncbi:MAG TPA: PadR family transcriptional regulator [Dehalococcoidia bacterium]|nr:PadR family transcriptional regulator [Dehalococcoidia bacterium]
MSLKHALLGILTVRPMTGYELKQFFDSSVQHFWNAELSQIYPTLKSLEEQGWVDKHVEVQESRPNKKIYEITGSGRDEFARWVRNPQPPADLRDPFLIKVFFGTELPVEDVLVLLRRQMEEQQKVLGFSESVLRERIREGVHSLHSTRHGLFWTLTLELANAYRRAYIDWCERSMRLLEESMLGDSSLTPIERDLAEEPRAG